MPVTEPRSVDETEDVIAVELFGLGTVYVDLTIEARSRARTAAGAGTGPGESVEQLVMWLNAADALPAGLLPIDFVQARASGGELIADAPAPLIEWSGRRPGLECPRVPGAYSAEEMLRPGRARLALDGSLRWTLEVQDGAGWVPVPEGDG
jgi:hypothetical protein